MILNIEIRRISTTYIKRPRRKVLVVQGNISGTKIGPDNVNMNTKFTLEYKNSVNGTLTYSNSKLSQSISSELLDEIAITLKTEIVKNVRDYLMVDYRKMIYNFIDKKEIVR